MGRDDLDGFCYPFGGKGVSLGSFGHSGLERQHDESIPFNLKSQNGCICCERTDRTEVATLLCKREF